MKINRMTSYAIRVINRMAGENRRITSKELLELEQIPHGVLMKVLRELKKAGVIASYQGRGGLGGGFELEEEWKNISLYQVLEIMEGGVTLNPEVDEEFYQEEKESLYEKLRALNEEYIMKLKLVSVTECA